MTSTRPRRPLHEVLPPLVLGTATFNTQYVSDPSAIPAASIIRRALDLGVTAFDTSPYYGPSESILGAALHHPTVTAALHPADRGGYFLVTKAGRIAGDAFDYSPSWIRYSIERSLQRLRTDYLDLVYMHDVEFVSEAEVLGAVSALRALRDEGLIRYIGISGYPVAKLAALAEAVLAQTGEPLDAVLSYAHFSVQNTALGGADVLGRFASAGVGVVLNASMLGMGLLTTRGADEGPIAAWHPAPEGLREKCHELVGVAARAGERLETVAIRWALDGWTRVGARLGSCAVVGGGKGTGRRIGVSVMGISNIAELEETQRVFNSVVEGLDTEGGEGEDGGAAAAGAGAGDPELRSRRQWSLERRDMIEGVVRRMWDVLGSWKDYAWDSPGPGFVNTRGEADMGVVPDDGVLPGLGAREAGDTEEEVATGRI